MLYLNMTHYRQIMKLPIVAAAALACLLWTAAAQEDSTRGDSGGKKEPVASDASKGKAVFQANCQTCHNAESSEPLIGPGLKDLFKWPPHKLSDGTEHTQHTVDIIKKQIVEGGGAMQPMGGYVSGADLDNLLAYLQTL